MNQLPRFTVQTLLIVTLVVAVCAALWGHYNRQYFVAEIARPNSGTYSFAEATRLLGKSLADTKGIRADHKIIQSWKGRTQSIRVHASRDGTIQVVDFFGQSKTGLSAVTTAIDSVPRLGNELSVLMTADTDGWNSPVKQQVIDTLFRPDIQVYTINRK